MKQTGMLLWIAGAGLAAYAFFLFDPSIDVGRFGVGRVVNLDLQQRQLMMEVAGCALFIAGVVLHALAGRLPSKAEPVSKSPRAASQWVPSGQGTPRPDDGITDDDLAAQKADSRAFLRRQ